MHDIATYLSVAQHYRDRAAHIRELAARDDNQDIRNTLTKLAATYDRLCQKYLDRAEQPGRTKTADEEIHGRDP
jgi:hypothetical protein